MKGIGEGNEKNGQKERNDNTDRKYMKQSNDRNEQGNT